MYVFTLKHNQMPEGAEEEEDGDNSAMDHDGEADESDRDEAKGDV